MLKYHLLINQDALKSRRSFEVFVRERFKGDAEEQLRALIQDIRTRLTADLPSINHKDWRVWKAQGRSGVWIVEAVTAREGHDGIVRSHDAGESLIVRIFEIATHLLMFGGPKYWGLNVSSPDARMKRIKIIDKVWKIFGKTRTQKIKLERQSLRVQQQDEIHDVT